MWELVFVLVVIIITLIQLMGGSKGPDGPSASELARQKHERENEEYEKMVDESWQLVEKYGKLNQIKSLIPAAKVLNTTPETMYAAACAETVRQNPQPGDPPSRKSLLEMTNNELREWWAIQQQFMEA